MRPRTVFSLALSALTLILGARYGAADELTPKQRAIVQSLKSYAESKPGMVNRLQQGTFYFKWLQTPPEGWDKACFKLGEMSGGQRFLSLQLVKKTSTGVELVTVNDLELNFLPEEAYRGVGKTIAEADKAIVSNTQKAKIPLSPELTNDFAQALDQLRWELNH